jgi:threonine/homoserine/homoserine lactone efflux protein
VIDPSTLWLFSLAALALLVVPGPAVLYIVGQAIDGGRKAGLVSMLGIQTGGLVHVLAAAVGISALIASSATAFTVVKLAGAAYLVVIGVLTLLRREPIDAATAAPADRTSSRRYLQGIVVNVLNPKTALFFLAFLPQFVDADAGSVGLQIVVLGLVFLTLAVVSDGAWALAAGTAGEWLRHHRGFLRARRYVSGTVFVALGVVTAFARRSHA